MQDRGTVVTFASFLGFIGLWAIAPLVQAQRVPAAERGFDPSGRSTRIQDTVDDLPDWTTLSPDFFPLSPGSYSQPVLRAADVTDATAIFVADPFLLHEADTWYMFFEVTTPMGKIALATSPDGMNWTYQQIVLGESFQLSYPYVFKHQGDYYMTPESSVRHSVRLYRAVSFPDSWQYVGDLVHGGNFADPTVFEFQDRWWMFVGTATSDSCFLYTSDSLTNHWTLHPQSPIVAGNRGRARPGGAR